MWVLFLILVLVGAIWLVHWVSKPFLARSRPVPAPQPSRRPTLQEETARMLRRVDAEAARMAPRIEAEAARLMPEIEAEVARLMPQIEAEAAKNHAELMRGIQPEPGEVWAGPEPEPQPPPPAAGPNGGPSWMSVEDWDNHLVAYRRQGRSEADIAGAAAHLEQRGPRKQRTREEQIDRSHEIGIVTRAVYVPKEDEDRYLTRDSDGFPALRLVDAGDRLAIWSPMDGGELINPKGPGLRRLGLYSSYVRGASHYAGAYRAADTSKGQWVDLKREPDNPHDGNAVAICRPGSDVPIGYVQKGRAPTVARRMDAGEDMVGVSMRGPGRGDGEGATLLIIGTRADLAAMLSA